MEIKELQEARSSKTAEFESIIALAKEAERKLSDEENEKVEALKREVGDLDEQIASLEKEAAENAEREAQEAKEAEEAERKAKDEVKASIEESLRAMSLIDAEAELDKAYIELDKAWENYYYAWEAAEEEAQKEMLKALIKEVLAEQNQRNLELKKEAELTAEREAKDAKIKELEEALEAERKLKEKKDTAEEAERQLQEQENQRKKMENNEKTIFDVIRAAASDKLGATVELKRAAEDGDTTAQAAGIPVKVKQIDRIERDPMWKSMGLDIVYGAKGHYTLPHEDDRLAQELVELGPIVGDTVSPEGIVMKPGRFGNSKTFTVEAIASAEDGFIESQIKNIRESNDKAIGAAVYAKALAAGSANEVATATTLSRDNLIDLMAEVEVDGEGSFLSNRKTFFETLKFPVDPGSGKFLSTMIDAKGQTNTYVTETGSPYFYSSLFKDGDNKQYVVYGDMSKIAVYDYGQESIVIDPYTKASTGQVVITVTKLVGIALKNPRAFSRTADLDEAV